MEENNKNGFSNGMSGDSQNNHTADSTPNGSNNEQSHYYSYGPFQSLNQDNRDNNEQRPATPTSSNPQVEVMPPAPVRPIYSSDSNLTPNGGQQDPLNHLQGSGNGNGGYNGYNGNGTGGNDGNNRKPQFQYNKPKSPVKTIIASVLAGMIIMTGGMYGADRANLFTGGNAAANEATAATNDNTITQAALPAGAADVADVVKKASPAVVKIETFSRGSDNNSGGNSGGSNNPFFNDPMYRYFFGDQFGNGGGDGGGAGSNNGGSSSGSSNSNALTPIGIGSGFIFDKNGDILTNAHVVGNADVIQVTLENDKTPYEAKLMGKSTGLDLAVLKIQPKEGQADFPYISLGNSSNMEIGSWVVAIGNPLGFDHTVTAGVLSARGRSITASDEENGQSTHYSNLLQTDASINPGNSGGPLLNMNGQVIGINTAVSENSQGIGFAIPSNEVAKVLNNLMQGKSVPATPIPFIGASLMTLTPEISQQLGVNTTSGSVVTEVLYRSPAYQADLRSYDVITGINGTPYSNSQDLVAAIQKLTVGDTVTLNVIRDGKKIDLPVKIGDRNQFKDSLGNSTNPDSGNGQ
ncbi:S1C family serine protease [Paenibacillus campi]|uniref:S1C family serine protease n=1 Tax=Paenibacillus campi TaxID=3106031 RepID=UPI002AFED8DF|nr:trypsin-like peptidase domain-containing protein [Paenibacillus sp. SGZ-1014]